MTNIDRKIAFLLSTSPYLDTESGEYDEAAMDLTANGVTIQKWISVKEALPDSNIKVLTYTTGGAFCVARYSEKFNRWMGTGRITATHWMPIPEPPK